MSTIHRVLLALVSGILIGLSAPPMTTGWFILFSFVPLLIALEGSLTQRQIVVIAYSAFLVLHIVAGYWTLMSKDSYLHITGVLYILLDPIPFLIPVLVYRRLRMVGGIIAPLLFPFIWVGFEYLRTLSDIANPMFTVGHAQTYDVSILQLASFAGVFGISFWIVCVNVILFVLIKFLLRGQYRSDKVKTFALSVALITVVWIPHYYGKSVVENQETTPGKKARIGIIQPNIDPYEKWSTNPGGQIRSLIHLTKTLNADSIDLVIWPETAIPLYVLNQENDSLFSLVREMVDSFHVPLLAGFTDLRYYAPNEDVPPSRKHTPDGRTYDIYNAAMMIEPGIDSVQKYYKMLLLPFFERVPFADQLSSFDLNFVRWNFGTGGYAVGQDKTIFRTISPELAFCAVICFESMFSGFVRDFVNRGAEFIVIVTNDSWWGDANGAYQHAQMASLRAVENRRWIARCANGGISGFIDPHGRYHKATSLLTQRTVVHEIQLRDDRSFYSEHGDWLPFLSLGITFLSLLSGSLREWRKERANEKGEQVAPPA